MNINQNNPADEMQPPPVAWIGLDWGDKEHAFALHDSLGKSEVGTLTHSAENLHQWLKSLEERYGGHTVALAIEASRGAVVHALLEYPWLILYPINPITSARYRSAFTPSGAKDDLPDAKVLLELVRLHTDKLRPLEEQDPATIKLTGLCEARRKLVDQRTQAVLRLESLLKTYYPQALEVAGDLKTEVAIAFLDRWPDLISLKATKPAAIKRFYYLHQVRSQELIEERLALIAKAVALTTDDARVSVVQPGDPAGLRRTSRQRPLPRSAGGGKATGTAFVRRFWHAAHRVSRPGQFAEIRRSGPGPREKWQPDLDPLALGCPQFLATNLCRMGRTDGALLPMGQGLL